METCSNNAKNVISSKTCTILLCKSTHTLYICWTPFGSNIAVGYPFENHGFIGVYSCRLENVTTSHTNELLELIHAQNCIQSRAMILNGHSGGFMYVDTKCIERDDEH
eukprot:567562_1